MTLKYSQFKLIYHSMLFLLKLLLWGGVIFWLIHTYKYFTSAAMIETIKSSGMSSKQLEQFLMSMIPWAKSISVLVVWVVIFNILIGIFKRATVSMNWLTRWDQEHHISNILGKRIAYHLRYNTKVDFESFIYMQKYSESEASLLKYHSETPLTSDFLKKYDKDFEEDLR